MSANNRVPTHFGPPASMDEVRLFGRWTLWKRFHWIRPGTDHDSNMEGAFERILDMQAEAYGVKKPISPILTEPLTGGEEP